MKRLLLESATSFMTIMLATVPVACFAQQSILGRNLIVNGGADAGLAGTSVTAPAPSIPGWTTAGGIPTVLSYNGATNLLMSGLPSPPDHSFQYFISESTPGPSILTQDIDVSSGASTISGGNVRFNLTAFIGSIGGVTSQVSVAFKNASGQTFATATIGPTSDLPGAGIYRQSQIGLVPVGTVRLTVTLSMGYLGAFGGNWGAADSLSLQLEVLETNPQTVLGPNLIINSSGDDGPGVSVGLAPYLPGWSTYGASVAPYGGTGWIAVSDPGPSDRGVNFFWGTNADMYQDVDVSAAGTMIDTAKVTYQVSAWLGALSGGTTPTLTYTFFDWSGKQLAATAQLGPAIHNGTSLVTSSHSDFLPAGTRRVHIDVAFPAGRALADNIAFTLAPAGAPVITPSGIVPIYSSSTTIQPGSWFSIYGSNLSSTTNLWKGDFPTSLGGVSVTVNARPAYLWVVTPTQINLQAPDDSATGNVSVVVTNQNGSATGTVTLGQYGPSFSLFNGNKYAAAIVPLPVGTVGNSGSSYDYVGPMGSQSFTTRPVKAGETLSLYGVGFGPTTVPVLAGQVFTGAATSVTAPQITIGGVPALVTFAGIVQSGLFQFNVVVPAAGSGDKLLQATIGGLTTPSNVYITLQ